MTWLDAFQRVCVIIVLMQVVLFVAVLIRVMIDDKL